MRVDADSAGREMHAFITPLYPLCRSITGNGVRHTLKAIGTQIPLEIREVPTGTRVLDWTIPKEWNIRDAWVKNQRGERVIDFKQSNLHVVGYSQPVRQRMPWRELQPHLFTLPDRPDWVPYRTSYYEESWGFCLAHRDLQQLPEEDYDVCIDASLEDGHLTYGECLLPGHTTDEILISSHVCHPSLANDNLSGIVVGTFLARLLASRARRYSYRFLFIPGTIGALTWLALNEAVVPRIKHGLVLTGVGDAGRLVYKRSRRGDAEIDRAVSHVLGHAGDDHQIVDFSPYGYDERQFCSPGFNLPVGCLMRTPHGRYPEYHTSADDLRFVRGDKLGETLATVATILNVLEGNRWYVNTQPKGEPQLGRRGLYRAVGGDMDRRSAELALLWVLNFSDGRHSLLDIAARSGLEFASLRQAADRLLGHDLLSESGPPSAA
jgi:aminopeptidase-like protein